MKEERKNQYSTYRGRLLSFSFVRLLQVVSEEGDDGSPKNGTESGHDGEGVAGGARGRCLCSEGGGRRGGSDENGAGDLPHLHG